MLFRGCLPQHKSYDRKVIEQRDFRGVLLAENKGGQNIISLIPKPVHLILKRVRSKTFEWNCVACLWKVPEQVIFSTNEHLKLDFWGVLLIENKGR